MQVCRLLYSTTQATLGINIASKNPDKEQGWVELTPDLPHSRIAGEVVSHMNAAYA